MHNKEVVYTIKKSRSARRMRLTVHQGGRVVVTLPRGMSEDMAARFVMSKVQWVLAKLAYFSKFPARTFIPRSRGDFLKYKESVRALVAERIACFNQIYQLRFNKISIKNQKTLWGSCSRNGNLNFNYKIVFLPSVLADYIIVHELCHLAEFSHSRVFWNLVSRAAPDHRAIRRELKKNSIGLL